MDIAPLLFAAPFAIIGFALSAWFLCCVWMSEDTRDPYDDPNNWGG